METKELDKQRKLLSIESKNGIDFTFAATIVWGFIAFIWTLNAEPYDKSILVFIIGGLMLPLALTFSKVFKTRWKVKDCPLQPLGLWLNLAQLLYFPFLVFVLIKMPSYFIMTYAIITGAHLFPYSWLYSTNWYAVFSGIISVGSMTLALLLEEKQHFCIGVLTSILLLVLLLGLLRDFKKKKERLDAL